MDIVNYAYGLLFLFLFLFYCSLIVAVLFMFKINFDSVAVYTDMYHLAHCLEV
jgi:hypothetical protein